MKKFLALLLCLSMILTLMPAVFATETTPTEDVTTQAETTAATTEATEETTVETTEETTEATEETTEATEETTEETTEATEETTEETTEPTEGESFTTFTTLDGNSVEVGDKIWIKNKQLVYKSTTDTEGYKTLFPHEITIEKITVVGDTTWFHFKNHALNILGYKYVKASSTSTTEPGENDCDCGSDSENLADHADDCARKKYVLSLIQKDGEFKTAEEIFEAWDNFDEETKTDIWGLLDKMDPELSGELEQIIEDDANGFRTKFETFVDTSSKGISASISTVEGQFPEGTTVTVTDTTVNIDPVRNQISGEVLGVVAVDISFGGQQPNGNVVVALNIPANQAVSGANMVYIVHNGNEIITSQYLSTTSTAKSITFGTSSFSSYAAVFVSGKYESKKMSDVLAGDSQYSIHNFKVNLFDYDPIKMNQQLESVTGEGKSFRFRGYADNIDGDSGTSGINDSSAGYAKQGIVANELVDGLPVFNYVGGTNGGTLTGVYLFGDTTVEGKTQYTPQFQFVYDNQTGYYQYKSAANHAQYNSNNQTIELYADTLSTENIYAATLDLTTASGGNGLTNSDTTNGTYKATAVATTSDNNKKRFDPYIQFKVPNEGETNDKVGQAASGINKIYVKAKVPAEVGVNGFQLFFDSGSGMNENESFVYDYTPTGDWIEFVIDTSTCDYWTSDKRIKNLRIDLFDSNRGAGLSDASKTYDIEIAQISLITEKDDYVTRGGFYPFSDIADSYPGNGSNFNLDAWNEYMSDAATVNVRSSRSINNPSTSREEMQKHLFFGVVMEFDFYIPVDKKVNDEELTYYFNGDDDLWVFIDGQLALDIGGGHGGITGEINLTQGTTTVDSAVQVTGYNTNGGNATEVSGQLDNSLTTAGKHTMKIFYMERCGSVSNCFMKFNLPQTPQGSVEVSKTVQNESGESIPALNDTEYTFRISAEFATEGTGEFNTANCDYILYGDNVTNSTGKTDENGCFKLKSGQKAVFTIPENYKVTVTETTPDEQTLGYEHVKTTLNNTVRYSVEQTTVKGVQKAFAFVNTYKPLYGSIEIIKSGISELDHDGTTEQQSCVFHIEGTTTGTNEKISMNVVIVGNGSKTIAHVPVGNYTVTELTGWTWRYELDGSNNIEVEVKGDDKPKAEFNNKRNEDKWLSGDNYVRNWWGKFSSAATT